VSMNFSKVDLAPAFESEATLRPMESEQPPRAPPRVDGFFLNDGEPTTQSPRLRYQSKAGVGGLVMKAPAPRERRMCDCSTRSHSMRVDLQRRGPESWRLRSTITPGPDNNEADS